MTKKINWQEHTPKNKQRFPQLGGWITHSTKMLLTLSFVFIGFYYFIWPQVKVNYYYASTDCLIMDKKIENTARVTQNPSFEPKFLAIYQINGKTYANWAYDILNSFYTDASAKNNVLNEFKTGQTYVCWYDAANPNKITLKKGWNHITIIFFFMTLIVAIAAMISFYKWHRVTYKKTISGNPSESSPVQR